MAKKGTRYSPEQREFLRKLIVDHKCISTQVSELTGIPKSTAMSMAKAYGVSPAASHLSSVERIKLARRTAELRLKYRDELEKLFYGKANVSAANK